MDSEYERFVTVHERELRRTAYLMCGDWERAEDAAQDALLKMYKSWHRLDRGPALRAYAHRAVTTAVVDQGRRPWRRERPQPLPERVALQTTDDRLMLMAALRRVPVRRRACLVLRFFADLSVEEVAEILGVTTGTVKSQTAKAIAQLRDEFEVNGLHLLLEDQ